MELAVQQQRLELAHASRLAVAGELTGAIAHEINQPLGAILSNADAADLLLASGADRRDELRAILADIRQDNLRASEVIRRLRALLAKQPVDWHPFDLNDAVRELEPVLRAEARRRGVALDLRLAATATILVGDRVQIQQVLLNLALNAMDAANGLPEARRAVAVSVERDADRLTLVVRDQGQGIAPEHLPQLFDSFFSTKPRGMGLGLSITRTLVEAHGGRIWAESGPRRGRGVPGRMASGRRRGHTGAGMTTPTPLIHVVDDDESLRTALLRLLDAAGFNARGYASVGDFLLQPPPDGPGCVLLDVRMPGPSGLDLQAALLRQGNALPVVFLTGYADVAASVQAMKAGAVDFLTKPVQREALFERAPARARPRRGRARGPCASGAIARGLCRADPPRASGFRPRRRRSAQQTDRRCAGNRGTHRQDAARATDGEAGREFGGRTRPVGRAAATLARLIPFAFAIRPTFALSGKPPCPFAQ